MSYFHIMLELAMHVCVFSISIPVCIYVMYFLQFQFCNNGDINIVALIHVLILELLTKQEH